MKLIVDIGNTNIVLATFEAKKALSLQRIYTDANRTEDEYAMVIRSMFMYGKIDVAKIESCLISSVVPKLSDVIFRALEKLLANKPVILTPKLYHLLPVRIPESAVHQIGTDILANAVAVYTKYRRACIAVDFGTALTFVAVDDDGEIQGVAIAPGLNTAVKSLFTNTAQLPTVPLVEPASVMGTDTIGAIQSGIIFGYRGLIKSMLDRMQAELKIECPCIATGGLSGVLKNEKDLFTEINVELTITGLSLIADILLA